ncbi:MAG: InlB B-repeat-containing protein, partial [Paludibacteraceae bacterium]|nr:InlB B-repeat-containing protein [Paludibacteraceae bacterium]
STEVNYYYPRLVYTFTLDAYTNGGTSEVPSIEVLHGATIGAVPPDAQKGCNDFTGWYTKPVGGVKITPEFVIEYDMKTLYAQFSDDVRTYPIIYNAGANGTGTVDAGTKTCGEDATLSSSTFTRDGYTQTGWSLTDGGAQAYALGGTYTENASLTLYPVWTLVGYQINFVDEDGTTTLGDYPKTLNPGATVTAPTEPTKAQTAEYTYTFAGWSDGTNTYTSDAIPNVTAAVTYTATYTATANVASVTVGTSTRTIQPSQRLGILSMIRQPTRPSSYCKM